LAGVYDYSKRPENIFRRHEFCRCTVTYQSEKKSQNVWSKREWKSSPEELERREKVGQTVQMSPAEKIQQANQLYQDKIVSGAEDRRKALRKLRKMSAEERLARLKELEDRR
jgi:hypothetical protein